MKKKILVFIFVFALVFAFTGCDSSNTQPSTNDVEIIVEEEVVVEGDVDMSSQSNVSSNIDVENDNAEAPVSSGEPTSSSSETQTNDQPAEDESVNIDYDWKSHSEDYKLLAFTFDDGPKHLMSSYVSYFAAFDGAGTFFVDGRSIKGDYEYKQMQQAINYGWDIGNHGDTHLVADKGSTEASYDEINADIVNLIHKLETNLTKRDGTPYQVNFYRPPNIKPTANTFKICAQENLAVIWLKHDALDWGSNTQADSYNVFKSGINTWKDGDVILCHETSDNTYKIIEELLPDYFREGYRFCSISELMELRGITIDQISGELNEVDGNRGMVTNIIDAAKQDKK